MTAEEALNLGVMYYKGEIVEKNSEKAFELFQESKKLGSQEVYRWLGLYYWKGNDSEINYKLAFKYFKKAIKFNPQDAKILWHLGECFYWGYGVTKDFRKYFKFNLQAAELGYRQSFIELRRCYFNGHGVEEDLNKALYWAEKDGHQRWIDMIKKELEALK